jgi:flagellin
MGMTINGISYGASADVVNRAQQQIATSADLSANLTRTQEAMSKSIERLSSGLRIGADRGVDAGARLKAEINGLNTRFRDTQDLLSDSQTAGGALDEAKMTLDYLKQISAPASAEGVSQGTRDGIQAAIADGLKNLDRINDTLKGNKAAGDSLLAGVSSEALGLSSASVLTDEDTKAFLSALDGAYKAIDTQQQALGKKQKEYSDAITTMSTQMQNMSAVSHPALSQEEVYEFTKNQILQQAGTAMLCQANQLPQGVLSLLR